MSILVKAAFLTDLFVSTNNDLKFGPIWAQFRHYVGAHAVKVT